MSAKKIYYIFRPSIYGEVLIAATNIGICAIFIGNSHDILIQDLILEFGDYTTEASELIASLANQVINQINGRQNLEPLIFDLIGTDFQVNVWQELQKIPYATTLSYTELAESMGIPNSFRAVANACAKNKIAILVPCHRVIRSNGGLAGYRWGLPLKEKLLAVEKNNQLKVL